MYHFYKAKAKTDPVLFRICRLVEDDDKHDLNVTVVTRISTRNQNVEIVGSYMGEYDQRKTDECIECWLRSAEHILKIR